MPPKKLMKRVHASAKVPRKKQKRSPGEIPISIFKATCVAVLKRVQETREPVRVTRSGKLLVEVIPPTPVQRAKPWLGCMSGTIRITGDIVSPVSDEQDWEALRWCDCFSTRISGYGVSGGHRSCRDGCEPRFRSPRTKFGCLQSASGSFCCCTKKGACT